MTRLSVGVVLGCLVLAGSSLAAAQAPAQGQPGQGQPAQGAGGRGAPQPPPQNLQVLPKDMARQQVVQIMQAINAALGVTCAHCHIFNGPNDPMNDFASDAKPQKNMARAMMRMTQGLGPQIAQAVNKPADQALRAGCAMCHRGAAIPVVAPGTPGAPPPPAAPAGGAPPAPGAGRGN
jgi:hypothetical protein